MTGVQTCALPILVNVLAKDHCHLTTLPVCPLKVSVDVLVPVQTVWPPDKVPPTVAGLTVSVTEALVSAAQTPLVTTAR